MSARSGFGPLAGSLLLAACGGGGGGDVGTPAAIQAMESQARQQLSSTATLQVVQRASVGKAVDATAFMDWAQGHYASYFPSAQPTVARNGFVFRYYPQAGNFMVVTSAGDIYFLGPATAGQYSRIGALADFSCTIYPDSCVPALTGNFVDGVVSGLAYSTSSGYSASTDAQGNFRYNSGDTVTFSLGGLVLGSSTGAALLSPVELAGGSNTRLYNMLVLLQSLDADGNPANGLAIPAAAAAAITAANVDLNAATGTFASSANTGLVAARSAGGITAPIASSAQAQASFQARLLPALAGKVIGGTNATGATLVRFGANGEYLQAQASPNDFCGTQTPPCGTTLISQAGVEYGTVTVTGVDALGFLIKGSPSIDTNLQAGLSHPGPTERARVGDITAARLDNDPAGVVGAWTPAPASIIKNAYFVFYTNGKMLFVGTAPADACGGPGVEFSSYSFNKAAKTLTLSNYTYDTSGCAGIKDATQPNITSITMGATLSADGQSLTIVLSDEPAPIVLTRISQ